jgi:hypothetical protein
VRVFLPKCWFDAEKCARGIDALKLYRAEYDDKLQALLGWAIRLRTKPKISTDRASSSARFQRQ